MNKMHNNRGAAFAISLFVLVVLLGLSSVIVLRTVHDSNMAKKERNNTKLFYISDGAAEAGLNGLNTLINNYLLNTISGTNPSTVTSAASGYVSSGDGIALLIAYVKNSGGVAQLTLNSGRAEYTQASTAMGSGTYSYKITITEKSNPTAVTSEIWDFPYYYKIEATGTVSNQTKKVTLNGDFTVRVQKDNFAKYALFTNTQTMQDGTNVWFTDKTNFAGPVFTNDRFNFAFNPSGTFYNSTKQVQTSARFYNQGSPVLINGDSNGTRDVPVFSSTYGFNRSQSSITLTTPTQKTDLINQATNSTSYGSNGIYLPNSGGSLTGGIYVKGDASISMAVTVGDSPVYTITQGSTTKTITVNLSTNQTTVVTSGGGGTVVYTGKPYGTDQVGTIVHVDGNITSLAGTVQKDTALTISSENNMTITNNLKYADYTPAVGTPGQSGYIPPSAEGTENLLGLVTWNGGVYIGTSAPDDVEIHGTILAKTGELQVNNYNDQGVGPRGTATLLGGVIQDNYGAFGLFNSSTGQMVSGYGRQFVYDSRLQTGNSPPYFPSLSTFVAFTNDITDKIVWQEGG